MHDWVSTNGNKGFTIRLYKSSITIDKVLGIQGRRFVHISSIYILQNIYNWSSFPLAYFLWHPSNSTESQGEVLLPLWRCKSWVTVIELRAKSIHRRAERGSVFTNAPCEMILSKSLARCVLAKEREEKKKKGAKDVPVVTLQD